MLSEMIVVWYRFKNILVFEAFLFGEQAEGQEWQSKLYYYSI